MKPWNEMTHEELDQWFNNNLSWLLEWLCHVEQVAFTKETNPQRFKTQLFPQNHPGLKHKNAACILYHMRQVVYSLVFSTEHTRRADGYGIGAYHQIPGFIEKYNRLPTRKDNVTVKVTELCKITDCFENRDIFSEIVSIDLVQESATPDVIDHLLKCIERSKKRPYHWKYGVVWLEPRKPKDITRE